MNPGEKAIQTLQERRDHLRDLLNARKATEREAREYDALDWVLDFILEPILLEPIARK